jgi:hypothetical protein
VKKRTADPWIPADRYGRMLPVFMANLLVRDLGRALGFYKEVLGARVHYSDPDFAALNLNGAEVMLHADHTYDKHPWHPRLTAGEARAGSGPSCGCSAWIPMSWSPALGRQERPSFSPPPPRAMAGARSWWKTRTATSGRLAFRPPRSHE